MEPNTAADLKGSNATTGASAQTQNLDKDLAELKSKTEGLEVRSKQLETENLRLQQDLSESTRFTKTLLEKMEVPTQTPVSTDVNDEEFAEQFNRKPLATLRQIVQSEAEKLAQKYVRKSEEGNKYLLGDLHNTKLSLAKMALKEKYDGIEEDWPKLVAQGDKYKALTQTVTDPQDLEAFYLMTKFMHGETPRKRNGKADMEAFLKEKLSASVEAGGVGTQSNTLTDEQKRIAKRYGMSDEDYVKFSDPNVNINEYLASRKEKK